MDKLKELLAGYEAARTSWEAADTSHRSLLGRLDALCGASGHVVKTREAWSAVERVFSDPRVSRTVRSEIATMLVAINESAYEAGKAFSPLIKISLALEDELESVGEEFSKLAIASYEAEVECGAKALSSQFAEEGARRKLAKTSDRAVALSEIGSHWKTKNSAAEKARCLIESADKRCALCSPAKTTTP
jgi:hypothetical protein